ncbi:hypothetical protein l11_03690 [Neisseria weaveri LMG 5135]|nr:hypothetical protein l11_03690 [Neisseria weaveri LMG 5135]
MQFDKNFSILLSYPTMPSEKYRHKILPVNHSQRFFIPFQYRLYIG